MRGRVWLGAVAFIALAGCERKAGEAPAPAHGRVPAMVAPARRPGLWEQRVSNGDTLQVGRICLDPEVDRKLSWWGVQATADICARNLVTHRPDGRWQFSSVCDLGSGGTVTTSGIVSGDFTAHYQFRGQSSTVAAAVPHMNGVRPLTVDAAWLGPCPADMKPGDLSLPGGQKMNMLVLHV